MNGPRPANRSSAKPYSDRLVHTGMGDAVCHADVTLRPHGRVKDYDQGRRFIRRFIMYVCSK